MSQKLKQGKKHSPVMANPLHCSSHKKKKKKKGARKGSQAGISKHAGTSTEPAERGNRETFSALQGDR